MSISFSLSIIFGPTPFFSQTEEEKEGRRLQDAEPKAIKRQFVSVKQKEAKAKRAKRRAETEEEREGRRLQDVQVKET